MTTWLWCRIIGQCHRPQSKQIIQTCDDGNDISGGSPVFTKKTEQGNDVGITVNKKELQTVRGEQGLLSVLFMLKGGGGVWGWALPPQRHLRSKRAVHRFRDYVAVKPHLENTGAEESLSMKKTIFNILTKTKACNDVSVLEQSYLLT